MVEISVVIPVYDCERYLDESVNGILKQTFRDIEVICVDDGSTDGSLEKLKEFAKKDSRLKVFHQEHKGGGDARNLGLLKASGKYLYFMDGDDMIHPEALKHCYEICEQKNLDFIIFKAISYDENTGEYKKHSYFTMDLLYESVGDDVFSIDEIGDLIFEFSATPWGKLYNREFVIKSKARFASGISFHDNKFFWEMLFNSKRICFLNEFYYTRRIHPNSLIGAKNKGYFDIFTAYGQIFEIFRKYKHFDEFKTQLYNWKVKILYFRLEGINGEYRQAFLERLKAEFEMMGELEGNDVLMNLLTRENKVIYTSAFESNTYREFVLSMKVDELKRTNRKLEKTNDKLMNSKSWKLTKPLRDIRKITRK